MIPINNSSIKRYVLLFTAHTLHRLSVIAGVSEQFVLQKVIKEVWYMCMECMHHMLLPMLKWDHDTVQASVGFCFPVHHYNGRQCTALEVTMEILKVGLEYV